MGNALALIGIGCGLAGCCCVLAGYAVAFRSLRDRPDRNSLVLRLLFGWSPDPVVWPSGARRLVGLGALLGLLLLVFWVAAVPLGGGWAAPRTSNTL